MAEEDTLYGVFQADDYNSPFPESIGSWKYITDDDKVTGAIWTDWKDGAGIVWTLPSDEVLELRERFLRFKEMGAKAGLAYSRISDSKSVEFSSQEDGELKTMLNKVDQTGGEKDEREDS